MLFGCGIARGSARAGFLSRPFLEARGVKALAVATFGHKLPLQTPQLVVEEIVRLVDQADDGVGHNRWVFMGEPCAIGHQIGGSVASDSAHLQCARVVLCPLLVPALAKEILVVEEKLVQTCPRHIHEPQFRLARCRGSAAPLGDVLAAASRRLHHLVMGARTLGDEAVAEGDRRVIDNLRHLKRTQVAVSAVGAQAEAVSCHGSFRETLGLGRLEPREAAARSLGCRGLFAVPPICGTTVLGWGRVFKEFLGCKKAKKTIRPICRIGLIRLISLPPKFQVPPQRIRASHHCRPRARSASSALVHTSYPGFTRCNPRSVYAARSSPFSSFISECRSR